MMGGLTEDSIVMTLKKKLTPWVILTLTWGCIHCVHAYDHYSQTSLLVFYLRSQVSVCRTIGPSRFSFYVYLRERSCTCNFIFAMEIVIAFDHYVSPLQGRETVLFFPVRLCPSVRLSITNCVRSIT